jgi:phosphotransferase system enzyme I (PtsI)
MPELLTGIGVSPGFAAGPVYRMASATRIHALVPVTDVEQEAARAVSALAEVSALLKRRAQGSRPGVAEILEAQAMMADDPLMHEAIAASVAEGADAPHAIERALAGYRKAFQEAGGYLAERVADLDDLRDRAVAACLGLPMPGIPDPGHPFVLSALDLAPADTAGLDPAVVLALVTVAGGPTSHTAIVAKALGLPAVVQCLGILDVPDGTTIAVDGVTGSVEVGVDAATVASITAMQRARRERLTRSSGPGRTADGHLVALMANIGSARDLAGTAADGAEGVGLFRTELLYLDRTQAPTLQEQIDAYTEVFIAAAGRRTVVRTLDAGADKPLAFLNQDDEPNPALGIRGLRLAGKYPAVLAGQLEAIATAAQATGADAWVMAPMVATAAEAAEFARLCRIAGLPKVGVMIEIPAAALQASTMIQHVDFLSIGTNDLSQYTFAADRQCGELASLLDPWQPALLHLIAACAAAGRSAGKPVGVCGEAASDPELAVVLAGLGVTSLSMSPSSLAPVRESLAARTLAECQTLARAALDAPDAVAARAAGSVLGVADGWARRTR